MERIAVGRVIAAAYSFAFRNYLRLVGIVWLPMLLSSVVTVFFLLPAFTKMIAAAQGQHAGQIRAQFAPLIGSEAFAVAMSAIACVGVIRLALGHKPPAPFVFFTLGADFSRTAAMVILFLVIFVVTATVGLLALGSLAGVVAIGRGAPLAASGAAVGGLLVFYIVAMLVVFRLGVLSLPVIVAEQRISLPRSWALARGNFWRLLVASLAVLAVFVVQYVLQLILTNATNGLFPGDVMPGFNHQMLVLLRVVAGQVLLTPLTYGVTFGMPAIAYRVLVPASDNIADVF